MLQFHNHVHRYPPNLLTVVTPTFSPGGGTYSSAQTVTISCSTPGSTIYYTTNGTTPTTGSPVYSTPITVASSETVQAIATAAGFLQSAVGSASYTIGGAANPQAMNVPGEGSQYLSNGIPMFINAIRSGVANNAVNGSAIPVTATGWPDGTVGTFYFQLWEGNTQPWMSGTFYGGYKISGVGTEILSGQGCTVTLTGTNGNGYKTFTVTAASGTSSLKWTGVTQPFLGIYMHLDGTDPGQVVDDPTQASAYTSAFINHYSPFWGLRFMKPSGMWTVTQSLSGAARHSASNTQFQHWNYSDWTVEGYPVEWFMGACRACRSVNPNGGNIYVNLPLIEDGTYMPAILVALRPMVTAGYTVILELPGNEDWNYTSPNDGNGHNVQYYFNQLTIAAGFAGNSQTGWGQYAATRMHTIANACRADPVIGPVFGTQVMIAVPWQPQFDTFFYGMFNYLSTTYYSGGIQKDVQLIGLSNYVTELANSGFVPQFIGTTTKNVYGFKVSEVTAVSKANPCVVTFNLAVNMFEVGSTVTCSGFAGMTQLNGLNPSVLAVGGASGAYTVSLNVDSTSFGTWTSGGYVDDDVPTVQAKMLALSKIRATSGVSVANPGIFAENTAVIGMRNGAGLYYYESAEWVIANADINLSNFAAAIADPGWQPVQAAQKQAGYNSCTVLDFHFQGGIDLGGQNPPDWNETTSYAAIQTNPIYKALLQFVNGVTVTRNVIGAPGAGPYVIQGGNSLNLLSGADPTFTSNYVPPNNGNYYLCWVIYSGTGGTYSLGPIALDSGSGSTNIEVGNAANGFTLVASGKPLPFNSTLAVPFVQGWNYLCLGSGSYQNIPVKTITLN